LSVYSKALLGLAFDRFGQAEQRDMLLRNIEQFLEVDAENQSAHLRLPIGGYWWYWYGSEVETTATYLKLLCKTKPHGENAAGIAKFLVNHRRHGSWWNSTRDTALSVEALADYLTASGEGDAAMNTQVELWLDGKKRHEVTFTRDTLFAGKDRLEIRGEELTAGKHTLEIRKAGNSRLYVNASLAAFTLEDNIPAAGLEVKVTRHYWKLTPKDVKFASATARGAPLEERKEAYTRTEIKDGDEVKSGDLIEAELIAESKNDYEYILVEDMKASGFEPVDVRSGYIFLNASLPAYLELHDERAAFFLRELPLGSHSLFYRLRAETPGVFHALPTKISAMYAPDLKGNSAELHVRVVDAEKAPHQ